MRNLGSLHMSSVQRAETQPMSLDDCAVLERQNLGVGLSKNGTVYVAGEGHATASEYALIMDVESAVTEDLIPEHWGGSTLSILRQESIGLVLSESGIVCAVGLRERSDGTTTYGPQVDFVSSGEGSRGLQDVIDFVDELGAQSSSRLDRDRQTFSAWRSWWTAVHQNALMPSTLDHS